MYLYYVKNTSEKSSTYSTQKIFVRETSPEKLLEILKGKIDFLSMVKGKSNNLVQNLYARLKAVEYPDTAMNDLLKLWEVEGIEIAMTKFNDTNA